MPKKKVLVIAIVMFTISSILFVSIQAEMNNGAGEIVIVDSLGREITIPGPVDNIVTLGVGYTSTVIELGQKDKIAGVDSYSTFSYTKNPDFEGLESIGSVYGDGTVLYTTLLQMRDDGKFGENDVVIAPNYSGINNKDNGLLELIESGDIEIKVIVISATSYDGVVDAVAMIGKVLGEESNTLVTNMQRVADLIREEVSNNNLSGAAGIHISSKDSVYNKSILTSMIEIAGGINAGYDGSQSGDSYSSDPSAILQMSLANKNTTIFLDGGHSKTASEYKADMNLSCNVIKMDKMWNNISPSAAEGLWAVASAMYPEVFPSDIPSFDDEPKDNALLYLGIGITAATILCVVAVLYLRRY